MADQPLDVVTNVITTELLSHRHADVVHGCTHPEHANLLCECGLTLTGYGDQWEAHLADACVTALRNAGLLPAQPGARRTNYYAEARWRAASIAVAHVWDTPGAGPIGVQLHDVSRETLTTYWPALARAVAEMAAAKAALLNPGEPRR